MKDKQHGINISKSKLTDHDYILLSRGLKFIPNPEDKNAKLELLKDFDELAKKMRCRYWFHRNSDKLHPFYQKTGYVPGFNCHTFENQGRIQGGGAPGARPPKIGKQLFFWRKIVIFYTKYPKNVRASARRNLFKCAPPPPPP